jgi:Domain of unknown function (DUF4134)
MLIHFGWPVFGLCAGIFLAVYFAVIAWLYFREDLGSFFKNKQKQETGEEETPELAGAIAPERGLSNVSLNDLDFGREEQQGDVPDLLEELKWFFDQAAKDQVPQKEILSLLLPILEPHGELLQGERGKAIREFMQAECREQLGYELPEKHNTILHSGGLAVLLVLLSVAAQAQDGNSGIQQATTMVKGYFDTGCNLMYAIGAVVGIVGAIKVYQKWNAGEPDTGKVAASWFGSCIFLVVVATVIKSFFGL